MTEGPFIVGALDIARHAGWAVGDFSTAPLSSLESRGRKPLSGTYAGPDAVSLGNRLDQFDLWVARLIVTHRLNGLVIEMPIVPPHGNATSIKMLMSMAGIALMEAHRAQLLWVREAPPSTVKKSFCGYGGPGKERVQAECATRGWAFDTPDEADALATWAHGASLWHSERR